MNSLIRHFLDAISERIFSLIGNSIGSAATTYHAASQAEQQSYLEDLARQYESEGKDDVAETLRKKAALLCNEDPASTGHEILHRVVDSRSDNNRLLSGSEDQRAGKLKPARTRRKSRREADTETPTE